MIKYPKIKFQSHPTPVNTIWICDKCERGQWCYSHSDSFGNSFYCCRARMRRGTPKEQAEAEAALEIVYN